MGIPLVAWLTGRGDWLAAFAVGTLCALIGAALWLAVRADHPLQSEAPTGGRRLSGRLVTPMHDNGRVMLPAPVTSLAASPDPNGDSYPQSPPGCARTR